MAGLSMLIGLKAIVLYMGFVYLRSSGMILLSVPLLYSSFVGVLVSIASHPNINLPLLLGKTSDGSFPLWAKILFGPFLGFIQFFIFEWKLKLREPVYTEISNGLCVGGWPSSVNILPPGTTIYVLPPGTRGLLDRQILNLLFVGCAGREHRRSQYTFTVLMIMDGVSVFFVLF